jgi:hypothetical protein
MPFFPSQAVEMVISALHVIQGADGSTRGQDKIRQLRDNANYFRRRLLELGYNVLGDWDSPVMVRRVEARGGWMDAWQVLGASLNKAGSVSEKHMIT